MYAAATVLRKYFDDSTWLLKACELAYFSHLDQQCQRLVDVGLFGMYVCWYGEAVVFRCVFGTVFAHVCSSHTQNI